MNERRAEVLALIPARGGSKSVPRKNLRLLAGKPLIAYSIEDAKRSNLITRVIVSTDDRKIGEVSRRYGAEVPFLRPPELAKDRTPDISVFQHALTWLQKNEKYMPDVVVQLRPTAPLRRVETIDRAIMVYMERGDVDSLRSVSFAQQSPYKMWLVNEAGCLEPVVKLEGDIEPYNMPRQALPRVYWQNGYIDITRPDVILRSGSMTGARILSFVIDEPCIDIDYEEHLQVVEKMLLGHGQQDPQYTPVAERFPS